MMSHERGYEIDLNYWCGACGAKDGKASSEDGYCFHCGKDDWEPVESYKEVLDKQAGGKEIVIKWREDYPTVVKLRYEEVIAWLVTHPGQVLRMGFSVHNGVDVPRTEYQREYKWDSKRRGLLRGGTWAKSRIWRDPVYVKPEDFLKNSDQWGVWSNVGEPYFKTLMTEEWDKWEAYAGYCVLPPYH